MAFPNLYIVRHLPQFRDTDPDALVGIRGYLYYFQDCATQFVFQQNRENEIITKRYGAMWVYTKYRIELFHKADLKTLLQFEAWMDPVADLPLAHINLEIRQGAVLFGRGRLETCLLDVGSQERISLDRIELPDGLGLQRTNETGPYRIIPRSRKNAVHSYTYTVRFTDLDSSMHVTNLRYVSILLDALPASFYEEHPPKAFEIHYLAQCYEGEQLRIFYRKDSSLRLLAVKDDGTTAAAAVLEF